MTNPQLKTKLYLPDLATSPTTEMLPNKLLYITPGVPVAGAEKFMLLLSRELRQDISEQVLVSLSNNNALQPEFDKSVSFKKIVFNGPLDFGSYRKLKQLIKAERPDTIFCINFYSYFVLRCALLFTSLPSKWIISYHSTIHVNRKERILHRIYLGILRKKDRVITVSEKQAEYTAANYSMPVARFETIHNGIDTKHWRLPQGVEERNIIRKQYGIPETAKVIIQAAAFRSEKNHAGAIRALQIIHQRTPARPYLLIVGDGQLKGAIHEQAKNSGVSDYIKFTGMQQDLRPCYWGSDVFTLCSTSVETFSIAALEAMSSGLPAVLTNIGGASEMVKPGVSGFLCDITDESIAEKWQQALRHTFPQQQIHDFVVNNFSAEKMLSEYKTVLQQSA